MKKILMVCESMASGVGNYVTQLCNCLCDEFEISVAYATRPETANNFKEFYNRKVKLIEVQELGNKKAIFKAIARLRKLEEELKPDIIHLHSSIAGGIGRLAFDGKKTTLIYTPHGYSFVSFGEETFKGKFFKLVEKILGKRNFIMLTCTESEDEVAKTLCKKTYFIETGLDTSAFEDSLKKVQAKKFDKFTVFTLGRICTQKQPELFNQIAEKIPEASFVWVGNGELENKLKADNIEVTGWKKREEALAIAEGADIFVLCSKGEAIAMSLLENMFLKKLCLVSNTVGNKSVIRSGKNGYVCDSVDDYVLNIKKAMEQFPVECCERAYSDIFGIYNIETMRDKYIDFYNQLEK